MDEKIIKVTDKGQISIPAVIREALAIYTGDKLILSRKEDTVILKKFKEEDFSDLLKLNEESLSRIWNNDEDEIWNSYLK